MPPHLFACQPGPKLHGLPGQALAGSLRAPVLPGVSEQARASPGPCSRRKPPQTAPPPTCMALGLPLPFSPPCSSPVLSSQHPATGGSPGHLSGSWLTPVHNRSWQSIAAAGSHGSRGTQQSWRVLQASLERCPSALSLLSLLTSPTKATQKNTRGENLWAADKEMRI